VPEITTPNPVYCPNCDGVDVRRSYPKGLWDALMIRLGKPPLRCRGCTYRFYRRLEPDERLGRPDISAPPANEPFI
jgi:hypothetical protein